MATRQIGVEQGDPQGGRVGKLLSPAKRREAVEHILVEILARLLHQCIMLLLFLKLVSLLLLLNLEVPADDS